MNPHFSNPPLTASFRRLGSDVSGDPPPRCPHSAGSATNHSPIHDRRCSHKWRRCHGSLRRFLTEAAQGTPEGPSPGSRAAWISPSALLRVDGKASQVGVPHPQPIDDHPPPALGAPTQIPPPGQPPRPLWHWLPLRPLPRRLHREPSWARVEAEPEPNGRRAFDTPPRSTSS